VKIQSQICFHILTELSVCDLHIIFVVRLIRISKKSVGTQPNISLIFLTFYHGELLVTCLGKFVTVFLFVYLTSG